jgi:ABC-2 type transport system ATP-binding protein
VGKIWLSAVTVAVGLFLAPAPASAFTKQDVTISSADGTPLAASLFLPAGSPPPQGWPAVVYMHGLAGNRSSMNTLAQAMGVVGEEYAVLTFDARGHGQSGGLIAIDGPREIADVRAVFGWLRDRPEIADDRIGAWGISYGGGAALNSLVAGVPWAAVEVAQTWTDLYTALAPQGLAKSGVIGGFLTSLPPAKVDPVVLAVRDAAFAGRADEVAAFAAERSSLSKLAGVRTPVFLMQGRRDFAFGLDQATRAFGLLGGPKRLWVGNHGHAPSTFPAADTPPMLAAGKRWFDRFLRGIRNGAERPAVVVAREASAQTQSFPRLPRTIVFSDAAGGSSRAIARSGRVVRTFGRLAQGIEVFGSPRVRVGAVTAVGGWSRLVAVLSARTPRGTEIVVAGGGVPTRPGTRTYTISLSSQATFVPRGSRLRLTLGASSLVQSPANLLYLDLPMAAGATLRVGATRLTMPVLAAPVSR